MSCLQKIKKMKKLLILVAAPLFMFMTPPGKELKIKGEISLLKPAEWIYLSYRTPEGQVKDSAKIEKGEFKFETKIDEPILASLWVYTEKVEGQKPKTENTFLFLQPGKMEVSIKDSIKSISVKGSQAHEDYRQYVDFMKPYFDRNVLLNDQYREFVKNKDEDGKKRIIEESVVLENQIEAKTLEFLKTHNNSPISLYLVKQYAGGIIDYDKVQPLFASLSAEAKGWPSGKDFERRLEIAKKTRIGAYAMEFTQNDTLGKPVSLSSFKGKYVLIDFWASWCGPCRRENPNVVKAFHDFKDKDFTVLGVSLDQPGKHQAWMDAIHKDGLEWTQVSDLKYWDNEVAKQYGIMSIPQNLLLDKEGKIIAKNIRGEELQEKLKELVK